MKLVLFAAVLLLLGIADVVFSEEMPGRAESLLLSVGHLLVYGGFLFGLIAAAAAVGAEHPEWVVAAYEGMSLAGWLISFGLSVAVVALLLFLVRGKGVKKDA